MSHRRTDREIDKIERAALHERLRAALVKAEREKKGLSAHGEQKVDHLGRVNASRPESGLRLASRELGIESTAAKRAMQIDTLAGEKADDVGVSVQLAPKLSRRGRGGEGRKESGISLAARGEF